MKKNEIRQAYLVLTKALINSKSKRSSCKAEQILYGDTKYGQIRKLQEIGLFLDVVE